MHSKYDTYYIKCNIILSPFSHPQFNLIPKYPDLRAIIKGMCICIYITSAEITIIIIKLGDCLWFVSSTNFFLLVEFNKESNLKPYDLCVLCMFQYITICFLPLELRIEI